MLVSKENHLCIISDWIKLFSCLSLDNLSSFISVAITSAPSLAKASAEALPMPWAAAVTIIFFPLSLIILNP